MRYAGYTPPDFAPMVKPGSLTRVTVSLGRAPVVLAETRVRAKAVSARGWRRGFDQRRQRGFGHFLTRADIEKRAARYVSDLLRGIPGVRILDTGGRLGPGHLIQIERSLGAMRSRGTPKPELAEAASGDTNMKTLVR